LRLGKASAQFDPDALTGPFSSDVDHNMSPGRGFDFNHHLNYQQETAFFDAVGADMLGSDVNLALESNWQIRATAQASPLGINPRRRPSPISQTQLFLDVDQLFGFESEQPQFGNYFFPPSNLDHLLTSTQLPSQIETFQDVNLDVWHPAPLKSQVRLPAGSTKQWLKSLPFANFEAFLRSQDIIFTNNETSTEQRLETSLSGNFSLRSSRNSLFSGSRATDQRLSENQSLFRTLGRLLPGESTAVMSQQQMTETRLVNVLLFSMMNGFVGLQEIPIENILKTMDHFSTSNLLFHILEKGPPFTSRTLADNMFRAAIEAQNERVVKLLLERKLVDVNDTVCFFRNGRYTPVERAASLRALGLVRILVEANADVNKSHENGVEGGALRKLLYATYRGPVSSVTMTMPGLVDTLDFLIRKGSKVKLDLLRSFLDCTPNEVVCLISRSIPVADHKLFFENNREEEVEDYYSNSTLLCRAAAKRDDITALTIFQNILELCERSGCSKCLGRWPNAVTYASILGAEQGHIKFVQSLMGYVTSTTRILSAAIKSGNTGLIRMVLDVDPKPERDPPAHWMRRGRGESILTTPLADAVRTRNAHLIKVLEDAGALDNLAEGHRLEALILAAAEAGNIHYMETLLKRASSTSHKYRITWLAVHLALVNGHDQVAKMLLSAGARYIPVPLIPGLPTMSRPTRPNALDEALRKRDPELVRALLSADIGNINENEIPNNVACWFDTSILSDLAFMFPDLPSILPNQTIPGSFSRPQIYPTVHNIFIECIQTENLQLFRTFLESVSTSHAFPWNSCLASAIRMGHREMVELFLQKGANPFDGEVLKAAIPDHKDMLRFLFGEDRKQRSDRKCVGAYTLKFAIGNAEVLGSLLENGLVNFIVAEDPIEDPNLGPSLHDMLTPLGLAISGLSGFCESDIGSVELLLRAGSDPNGIARIKRAGIRIGQTALMLALETGSEDLVRLLVVHGADVNKKTHLFIKRTPLQYAAELGNLDMVQLLLELGAEVNEEPASWSGGTALQFAAISGNCNVAAELLERGAHLHAPPSKVNGRWPLEGAAENGRLDMIQFLWRAKEFFLDDTGFERRHCLRAMDFARSNGHLGCRDLVAELSGVSVDKLESEEYGVPWLAY
jgi:ankyrin repeat protein